MNDILGFYLNCKSIREKYGHTHSDFLNKFGDGLEHCHTFIQMAFPLKEASSMVKGAPVLDDETIAIFNDSMVLTKAVEKSYFHMMNFLQLILNGNEYSLALGNWYWVKLGDHNYLRITRMILSLKLLGLKVLSDDLYNRVKILYSMYPESIGPVTFQYWTDAYNKE
jgi:hypothetical protein